MIRNTFIFLGTFVAGALIALIARAAMFEPRAEHAGHAAAGGDYAPLVTNTLAPAENVPPATDAPLNHTATPSTASDKPVNTVCAICGMDVDPKIPTAQYEGKTIGFGCKLCPPKFKADPERWGPLYLRNEVAKK